MRDRADLQYLTDARDFAAKANFFAGGMSLEMLRDVDYYDHATRSYLIIVGEALSSVSPALKDLHPEIPWAAVRGLRNRLVHAYWRVDHEIVQRIVRDHLPELVELLDAMMACVGQADG